MADDHTWTTAAAQLLQLLLPAAAGTQQAPADTLAAAGDSVCSVAAALVAAAAGVRVVARSRVEQLWSQLGAPAAPSPQQTADLLAACSFAHCSAAAGPAQAAALSCDQLCVLVERSQGGEPLAAALLAQLPQKTHMQRAAVAVVHSDGHGQQSLDKVWLFRRGATPAVQTIALPSPAAEPAASAASHVQPPPQPSSLCVMDSTTLTTDAATLRRLLNDHGDETQTLVVNQAALLLLAAGGDALATPEPSWWEAQKRAAALLHSPQPQAVLDRYVALSSRYRAGAAQAQEDVLTVISRQRRLDVEAAKAKCSLAELQQCVARQAPPLSDFAQRLRRAQPCAILAEIKRASPSKGDIAPGIDAAAQAWRYAEGGAAAISVLTEPTWFKGTLEDMRAVRAIVDKLGPESRPCILRKDFLIDEYQIFEARLYGADTCLLIVAILNDAELEHLLAVARSLGMEPLVEVATAEELQRALKAGSLIIGINNRNLRDFTVDAQTTHRVLASAGQHISDQLLFAALSGISHRLDVQQYCAAGCQAMLVGEALMRAADPAAMIAGLRGLDPRAPLVKICGLKDADLATQTCAAGADMVGLVFAPGSKRLVSVTQAQTIAAAVRSLCKSAAQLTPAWMAEVSQALSGAQASAATAGSAVRTALQWYQAQAGVLRHLCAWRPLVVGVFANQPVSEVLEIARAVPLDVVQLSGTEGVGAAADFNREFVVIKAQHVGDQETAEGLVAAFAELPVEQRPHAVLLDTKSTVALGGTGQAFDWSKAAGVESAGLPMFLAGGLQPDNVAAAVAQVCPFALDVSSGVETAGGKDVEKIKSFIQRAKKPAGKSAA